jgi:hypothetical protein
VLDFCAARKKRLADVIDDDLFVFVSVGWMMIAGSSQPEMPRQNVITRNSFVTMLGLLPVKIVSLVKDWFLRLTV